MKRKQLWAIAVICLLVMIILFLAIARPVQHVQSIGRLHAAKKNVQNISTQVDSYLNQDFMLQTHDAPQANCKESSPPFSLMRDGICTVTKKLVYTGRPSLTDDKGQRDIMSIINGLHAGELSAMNAPDDYVQSMQSGGTWGYDVYIPATGIKGVPQTNSDGAMHIADVYADLSAAYLTDTHNTSLTITVGQTYASCRGIFLPCTYYMAK